MRPLSRAFIENDDMSLLHHDNLEILLEVKIKNSIIIIIFIVDALKVHQA